MYFVINEKPETIIEIKGNSLRRVDSVPVGSTVLYFSDDTSCTKSTYKDFVIEKDGFVFSEKSSEAFKELIERECLVTNPLIFFKREPSTLMGIWFKDLEVLLISYVNVGGEVDITRYMVNVGDSIEDEIENTIAQLRLGGRPDVNIYGYNIPFDAFWEIIKGAKKDYFYPNPCIEKKRKAKKILYTGIALNVSAFLLILSLSVSISILKSKSKEIQKDVIREKSKIEELISERRGYLIRNQGVFFKNTLKSLQFLKDCRYDSIDVSNNKNSLTVTLSFSNPADFIETLKIIRKEAKDANSFWDGTTGKLKIKFATKSHIVDSAVYDIAGSSVSGDK